LGGNTIDRARSTRSPPGGIDHSPPGDVAARVPADGDFLDPAIYI